MLQLQDIWAHLVVTVDPAVSHFSYAAGSLMMVWVLCLSPYKNTQGQTGGSPRRQSLLQVSVEFVFNGKFYDI